MRRSCSAAALFAKVVALPVNVGPFDSTTFPVPVDEAATASDGVVAAFVTVGTSQDGQLPGGAAKEVMPPLPPHGAPVLVISPALLICRQELPEAGAIYGSKSGTSKFT